MFPRHWQDLYELTGSTVPQSVHKLFEALKFIKKAFPAKKKHEGPKANMTGGGFSKKWIYSFSDQIPKKSHKETKHCALCKKHGGTQNTYTGDCKKYNLDDTP